MDSQWYEMFTTGITLERAATADSYGNAGYAAAESISGRIEPISEDIGGGVSGIGMEPHDPSISVRVITECLDTPITIRAKVTLPAGEVMYVREVTTHYDEVGPHHTVLSMSTEDEQ